jgi:glutamyl-tRNA reductase
VRSETELGQGTLSVARVGVELAARVFGTFEDERALIVGAGETGVLVARHLRSRGISALAFANRTLERAQAVALEFQASSHGLEELPGLIARVDIVVAAIDGANAQLSAAQFDRKALKRRDKPLLILDLSVPRAVDPAVAKLGSNVLLYDLDDLSRVVHENRKEREHAIEGTSEILVSELHKFLSARTYAAFTPAITTLRERFEGVREEVLDRVSGARSNPRDVELAHELTKRLLDVAMVQMKESAKQVRTEETLDLEYQRFLENL